MLLAWMPICHMICRSFLADRTAAQYDWLLAWSCRPSVCLSVCLWCIAALRVGVQGWKLYHRVPSRHVPICRFRHFSVRCIVWPQNAPQKNESKKKRAWVFSRPRVCPLLTVDLPWPFVSRLSGLDLVTGSECVHKRKAAIRFFCSSRS